MNAIVLPREIEVANLLREPCDVCGGELSAFCKGKIADCRERAAALALAHQSSVESDLDIFALRARRLAADWICGILPKTEAVDRAYNFALAIGLHYKLAGTIEALCSSDPALKARALRAMTEQKPIDAIQRVLGAFFSVAGP
jgi:hypothetical protein